MMKCVKEKNLVKFMLLTEETEKSYCLDINTGLFYGLTGKPIKTCPSWCLTVVTTDLNNKTLGTVLRMIMKDYHNTIYYKNYIKAMQCADKLDSIGVICEEWDINKYNYLSDNINYLFNWVKINNLEKFCVHPFKTWCEFEKAKVKYGNNIAGLTADMYEDITRNIHDLTDKEIAISAHYLGKCRLWDYTYGDTSKLQDYILKCRSLNKIPEKTNNFTREYCETMDFYKLLKTKIDNEQIVKNYEKQAKAWEFEYDGFIVKIPQSGEDLIREGQEMHHCVGSYVNRIIQNNTYICFIRKKDNPDKCYITCQIDPNYGDIIQYYLAYDRYISIKEDIVFKQKFQEYLHSIWKK